MLSRKRLSSCRGGGTELYMFSIIPTSKSEVTRLICPHCKEKIPRIGVRKDSKLDGLTFKCRRCGLLWEVKTK